MIYILDLLGLNNLTLSELMWVTFGTLGQLIFFSRWIVQWFFSEKNNKLMSLIAPNRSLTKIK